MSDQPSSKFCLNFRSWHCPECNGSGVIPIGSNENGWEPQQCQWCDEFDRLMHHAYPDVKFD